MAKRLRWKDTTLHNLIWTIVSVIYICNWLFDLYIFYQLVEMCEEYQMCWNVHFVRNANVCANCTLCPSFPVPLCAKPHLHFVPNFQIQTLVNCKLQLPFRKLAWFHWIKESRPFGKLWRTTKKITVRF